MSSPLRELAVFIACLVIFSGTCVAEPEIMSWGVLGAKKTPSLVSQVRIGCPRDPKRCVDRIGTYRGGRFELVSLAIKWRSLSYEEFIESIYAYRDLIDQSTPNRVEISIDDFGAFLRKYGVVRTRKAILLLSALKESTETRYDFGVTVYEDELGWLIDSLAQHIPSGAIFDRLALFLHYRSNYVNLRGYIQTLRDFSPNSRIYLGVYHYDRSAYVGCSVRNGDRCTDQQEMQFFEEALKLQVELVRSRVVDGLELYPGYFGSERSWAGWENPKNCQAEELDRCIAVSEAMAVIVDRYLLSLRTAQVP